MIRDGILFLAVGAALTSASPITYQGQLVVDGLPAAGAFDIEFRIFDEAIDGQQVGQTVFLDDHIVAQGLLTAAVDFGDAFDSTDSYLEISIRPGVSEDGFDTLLPRQLVTPSPKAIHAQTADALLGPGWADSGTAPGGGAILKFGDGFDRVVLNRDSLITPFEYFGVHIDNPAPGFGAIGGIVISNEGAENQTFLAHATGGEIKAWELYNGSTNTWTLKLQVQDTLEDALKVESSGITAPNYTYTAPVAGAVTIAGDVFHSALGTPFRASFFGGGAYLSTAGDNAPLVAPVTLPHNATIVKLTARFEDNAASDIAISLLGANADDSLVTIASVDSEDFIPVAGIQSVNTIVIDKGGSVIDNFSTGYYIRVFSSSWPGDSSLRIWSVTIEYTVNAPD